MKDLVLFTLTVFQKELEFPKMFFYDPVIGIRGNGRFTGE